MQWLISHFDIITKTYIFLWFNHAPEKRTRSLPHIQIVILYMYAEISDQCPLPANPPSLSSPLPLGLDCLVLKVPFFICTTLKMVGTL